MALGLLDGYNNRLDRLEPIEERDLYSERRDKFLKETNYIAIKYGDQAKTYEEAKQTLVKNQKSGKEFPLIERIRNSLNSSTTNCLVAVLTKLYKEKATINVYLEKAKKDFKKRVDERELGDIDWSEDHISPQLLPSLKYYGQSPEEASLSQPCDTMENSNFIDKKDSTEATRVIAPAPTELVEPSLEPPADQIQASVPDSASEAKPTPVSTTKPTLDSAEELNQGLLPEPAQEPSIDTASKPALCDESKPDRAVGLVDWLRQSISVMDKQSVKKAMPLLISAMFLFITIVALAVTICFQLFPSSPIFNYPLENGGNILVEKLTCSSESVKVYPGEPTTLPIRVIPSEADGVFLYCTSLNEDILYGHDGTEAKVEVIGHYELGDPPVEARVMVIPQNRATSNVYIEIPVIINYTRTMQEPH